MAELHVLGQICSANNFPEKSSLFCRYSFQTGPNWTIVSGYPEGQTASAKTDYKNAAIWSQPMDLHYVSNGIQGWPKIALQVSCLDVIGRSWTVGYSCSSVPTVPGYHRIQVPCWIPSATTITDSIRQYFFGGSHQLLTTDIISLGTDRYKLKTQSKGQINLEFEIILRNFTSFGVEYK